MKSGSVISGILLSVCLLAPASAAPPTLDAITPAGGERGTEVKVELVGKIDPWPCQLSFSEKGFQFTPDPEKKNTGTLKVPAKCDAEAILIRAKNDEGVSEPIIFAIGNTHEKIDPEEDDNRVENAAALDPAHFPLVINGRLRKSHESDAWKIPLKKGQTIYALVDAYALRSPIDPALHVYDSTGNRIAMAHDGPVNLDPRLEFTAPETGHYTIAMVAFAHPAAATVHYTGSDKAGYRLHLGFKREQLPAHFFPGKIKPDKKSGPLTPPLIATGHFAKPSQKDSFTVPAKKGESWWVEVDAYSLGFPTDPVLSIFNKDDKLIKEIDDVKPDRDAEYLWKVSADGDYRVEVKDRLGRSGDDFRYRLKVELPVPDFEASIEKSHYTVKPDEEISVKITITRKQDHKVPLSLEISPLPAGLALTPPETIPEKSGDVTFKLKANPKAAPFSGPVKILLKEIPEDKKNTTGATKSAVFNFRDDASRGPYLIDATEKIWLTIPPKKEEKKKNDDKEKKK